MKKRFLALIISILLFVGAMPITVNADEQAGVPDLSIDCKSAILMEASTGRIMYEKDADIPLPPASVTKVMTLLLVMEAIDAGRLKYDDMVSASAHACSMGGSQIYLKEGEQMSVDDLLKSVVIASANDAAVALAERVAGSEEAFVALMNKRAEELGMKNSHFENTNGLDDTVTNHTCSARDIAVMSRALLKHEKITEYSKIWMTTIRDGAFGLTNTNRLVRFYEGATGLKTGSTAKAGFCISATAKRDGMELIAVIMGSSTRDLRNSAAATLLNYGFANYEIYHRSAESLGDVRVVGGDKDKIGISCGEISLLVKKSEAGKITFTDSIPERISAPAEKGGKIGERSYYLGEELLGKSDIITVDSTARIGFFGIFLKMLGRCAIF